MNKRSLLTSAFVIAFSLTANAAGTPVAPPSAPVSAGGLLVQAGVNNSLTLTATGDAPITYQWKKGTAKVGAASASNLLQFTPMKATDGGVWSCTVSNAVPSTATSPGTLITVADTSKFAATPINEGGTLTATVTLTPANAAATYHWYVTGNDSLTGLGTVTGQNTRTLTIKTVAPAAACIYKCDVTLGAATLTLSTGAAVIAPKPVVHTIAAQNNQIGDNVSISVAIDNAPTSATVTGLPAGLRYAFSAGVVTITGKPTTATPPYDPAAVVVTGTNKVGKSLPMAFAMTVNPLDPGEVGTFNGIIPRSAGAATTSLGGKITVSVTSAGTATGTITLGAAAYPFTTQVTPTDLQTCVIAMNGLKSGTLPLLNFSFTITSDDLSGTLACNGLNYTADALRNVWHTYNQAPLAGNFNCAFKPDTITYNTAGFPHGNSFGTFAVSTLGAVTFTGRLADGTAISAASSLAEGGDVPLFITLYGGQGSVLGVPNIDGTGVSGALNWNKLAAAGGRQYKSGFTPIDLECTGAFYVKPNATLNQYFIGLPAGVNNGRLFFIDSNNAHLLSPVSQTVTVSLQGAATIAVGTAFPSGSTVNLTLNAATGAINGTFTVTDPKPAVATLVGGPRPTAAPSTVTRTGTWYGLAVTGQDNQAYGFYTLPDLPYTSADPTTADLAKNAVTSGVALLSGAK